MSVRPLPAYDSEFANSWNELLCPGLAVYQFRSFRNTDPPRLAEIWREQPPQRGLAQPVTAGILEQFVFSKPYFDPAGLIVALVDNQPVGFIHAGFGPNEEQTAVAYDSGTTYQLMLRPNHRSVSLAGELLTRSEAYLRERGAKVVYAGGIRPLNAFYLGLYGGSELPGVLTGDVLFNDACRAAGYREIDRVIVMRLDLPTFRLPIARNLRQLRRELTCQETQTPPAPTGWEGCTTGACERVHFFLARPGSSEAMADVWFWDVEPLSSVWGANAAGMFDLCVLRDHRRKGLATFLLAEAFDRLRARGVLIVEAQTMQHNDAALALYRKLGFQKVDEGVIYRKDA